jgi:branched-chain amino acid transport system ATP-binding protein
MPMLSVRDLDVRYGEIRALRGISFEVAQGEVVTLLGGNGAGKSTSLRAISGLIAPRRGDITFDGESIVGMSPERIARMGIVHVPEGRQVIPGLSVLDNLRLGSSNRRMNRADVSAGVERVFEVFPLLRDLRSRLGWSLSGGEQQMLAIGRGMMANPRLLMLDEPSLGLAPIVVQEVFRTIRHLHESGMTVLLVEQNAYQALKVADRGYVVETGRLAVSGRARDLLDDDQVRSAYLGKNATRTPGVSSVEAAVTGPAPDRPAEPDGRP